MSKCSIILSIFNKENIIKLVIDSLFNLTSDFVNEYIFILDGCTDSSETILNNSLINIPNNCTYKIIFTPDVFELRANNTGLRACNNDYAIIVQDDMQIMEKNWDIRLLEPILKYNDIWAVTARTTCSLGLDGNWYNIIEGPVGHNYGSQTNLSRNNIYIGQVVNRGPLLLKMSIMRDINYFDESLPGCTGCDDVDACLKVYQKYNLRCCSFWIEYYSPLEWGTSRTGPNISYCYQQEILNKNIVIERYKEILKNWNNDEIRKLN